MVCLIRRIIIVGKSVGVTLPSEYKIGDYVRICVDKIDTNIKKD